MHEPGGRVSRAKKSAKKPGDNQFTNTKRVWTFVNSCTLSVLIRPTEDPDDCDVGLALDTPRSSAFIPLAGLTLEELMAFKRTCDIAFEAAAPICELRDRIAEDALADGVTSHNRNFRPTPVVWRREGDEFKDGLPILPSKFTLNPHESEYMEKVVGRKVVRDEQNLDEPGGSQ